MTFTEEWVNHSKGVGVFTGPVKGGKLKSYAGLFKSTAVKRYYYITILDISFLETD